MARRQAQHQQANRAAIYARVSDKSQAGEDKTSLVEQTTEMEAHCERRGLDIVERYQEVGRGSTKNRPEFQRMLEDARKGRFDTIVCWKSDRLSRGVFPAAALMEVVEAYRLNLEAVMDSIDMKTFALMAAVGKMELDNFRERASLGKRGTAKQGRIPIGSLPYGYRIGDDGKAEIEDAAAETIRRIFQLYVRDALGSTAIARRLTLEGVPAPRSRRGWNQSSVQGMLANTAYKGTWFYGRSRHVLTEHGVRIYDQPEDSWIGVPVPALVDEQTWDTAQVLKKQRLRMSTRNTKIFYLLQKVLRCSECGLAFLAQSKRGDSMRKKGILYQYKYEKPRRYYVCAGVRKHRLPCRSRSYFRAEPLEELIWEEVKRVLKDPSLIVAGIECLESQEDSSLEADIAETKRELRSVQHEEDRAIRLFVSGKVTEDQLDLQRKFITERLERLRAKLADYQARALAVVDKRDLAKNVLAWVGEMGQGLDELPDEEKRDLLRLILNESTIDGNNKVSINLAVPVEDSVSLATTSS